MKGEFPMQTRSFIVKAAQGLHARPCANLAATPRNFESSITMSFQGKDYDASNPIALMSASVSCNDEIIFRISGNDECEAADAIQNVVENEL